jgi:hexosaminidase
MKKVADKGKFKQVVNPGFLNKNFHVYVWNNAWGKGSEDLPYKLANAGYKVILAPVTNFYFDLAYTKDVNEPGLYWGGFIDTDKPFYFNPLDQYKTAKEMFDGTAVNPKDLLGKEWLTEEGKSNIVGIQCLLWTEKVTSAPQLEYMLFPKMIGFAERAWAKEPDWAKEKDTAKSELLYRKDWARFSNTLGRKLLPHLDYFEDGINYRIPPAGAVVKDYKVYALAQFPGLVIRYTTDGSEPNASSKIYTIPVRDRGLIKLRVFNARGNRFSRTVEISNP